jgi:hypothetical protein
MNYPSGESAKQKCKIEHIQSNEVSVQMICYAHGIWWSELRPVHTWPEICPIAKGLTTKELFDKDWQEYVQRQRTDPVEFSPAPGGKENENERT